MTPEGGRRWRLDSDSLVADTLGVIAADAIVLIAGERDGRSAVGASPPGRPVVLDSSQSPTRRWSDMNTCGDRHKKARFLAGQRATSGSHEGEEEGPPDGEWSARQ